MTTRNASQYRSNHTWSVTSGDASSQQGYDDDDTSTINDDNEDVQPVRLIIAIDFGTTFTGIAYATPHGSQIPLAGIENIKDWGYACQSNLDKIDSVISYSARTRDGREANWGANLAPGAIAMKHMKLRLDVQSVSEEIDFILQMLDGVHDLNFDKIRASGRMEEYTHKPAEAVVADYLTKVFEHVLQTVDRFSRELREEIVTDIVFTVPVGWSYLAKNATYRAITKAGFNKKTFPQLEDILLITEPEAAAIYAARYFDERQEQVLREDECFILVDAGGGTVDIVSYRVDKLSPLKIVRVGLPTGRKCGSIFINLAFKQWLRWFLTDEYYLQLDPDADLNELYGAEGRALRQIMSDFDVLKKSFSQVSGDSYLTLPSPLRNLTMPGKVEGGQITITNEKMREFFDPCIDEIVGMIKLHIDKIDEEGYRVKNVFLVGGFGESRFLQQEIEDSLRRREDRDVHSPEYSWTAVARGAVLSGVEKDSNPSLVKTSACPKHYGIAVDENFSASKNPQDKGINAYTGRQIAQSQMKWLFDKGDLVPADEPVVKTHTYVLKFKEGEVGMMRGEVVVYSYADEKHRPTRLANALRELVTEDTLAFDLTPFHLTDFEQRQGRTRDDIFYAAPITFRLSLTASGLKSELLFKDKIISVGGEDWSMRSTTSGFASRSMNTNDQWSERHERTESPPERPRPVPRKKSWSQDWAQLQQNNASSRRVTPSIISDRSDQRSMRDTAGHTVFEDVLSGRPQPQSTGYAGDEDTYRNGGVDDDLGRWQSNWGNETGGSSGSANRRNRNASYASGGSGRDTSATYTPVRNNESGIW